MNLDDLERLRAIDRQDMLGEIDGLPAQLERAYELGMNRNPVFAEKAGFSRVVIAGMGGSAIGADLLASYAADLCPIPVVVHRDYGLPAFARGRETLVVCSSHSGNTEEDAGRVRRGPRERLPRRRRLHRRGTRFARRESGSPRRPL